MYNALLNWTVNEVIYLIYILAHPVFSLLYCLFMSSSRYNDFDLSYFDQLLLKMLDQNESI